MAWLQLLIWTKYSAKKQKLNPASESGIAFWSDMYITIIVAMAAKQNVVAAVSNGWLAIIAGVLAVAASFIMVPILSRIGRGDDT